MSLEDFIKQLRKAAGRGNNTAEIKFYHYSELTLNKIEQGKDGELVLAFGKPLVEGWEENYVLPKMMLPASALVPKNVEVIEVENI